MGPKYVAIKKGEHGALAFRRGRILQLRRLSARRHSRSDRGGGHFRRRDGRISGRDGASSEVDFAHLRKAIIYGSVLASFNVEAFSLERLRSLTRDEIDERYEMFRLMSQFEVLP